MLATETNTNQIRAHHRSIKRLGTWTTASRFDIRATRGSVVLDLLLPKIEPGEITLELDLDHSTVILLVPDATNIDDDNLRRIGRGRIKDWTGARSANSRTIKLVGEMRHSEVRVHRGGIAIMRLMLSRQHRTEIRQARCENRI